MYLVCGEALFDIFSDDQTDASAFKMEAVAGGSPFNVAIGIARLGGKSALLTGISYDMLGQRLAATLERENVSTKYLVRSGNRTTLSLVGIDRHGHPGYVFYGLGSADCNVHPQDLPTIGNEITGIHFGSYSLVVRPVADAVSSLLHMAGGRFVSVDPNVRLNVEPDIDIWRERLAEYAARADLLKISTEDMQALYTSASVESKVADWLDLGVRLVIVTDGSRKVSAWNRSGDVVQVEPPATDVVDTVGAGDSFQAAVLAKLAEDGKSAPKTALDALDPASLKRLLIFGVSAAGITCQRRGADLPRRNELVVDVAGA